MKMYILIKDSVPLGYAIVAAAHASLAAYLKFRDSDEVKQWLVGPFRKAVCKVSAEDFEKAKAVEDHVGGATVARPDFQTTQRTVYGFECFAEAVRPHRHTAEGP